MDVKDIWIRYTQYQTGTVQEFDFKKKNLQGEKTPPLHGPHKGLW